jgi:hypothetical protein
MSWRLPALASLVLLWAQLLLTTRWAHIDGALHGPKRPFFIVALAAATIALLWPRSTRAADHASTAGAAAPSPDPVPLLTLLAGAAVLVAGFIVWFPPSTWTQVPYLDNWATRYRTTVDGIALLREGAATGWNWHFLGGYSTATDITQNLTALAFVPVAIAGPALGFHLLHAVLFLGIPALVFVDLQLAGERGVAGLATGLTALCVAGFSFLLLRSGDTNSLAGVLTSLAALVAAHAARHGRPWGPPLLFVAIAFVAWSHTGFVIYTLLFLLVDAALVRSWRSAALAVAAGAVAILAALPFTWELWRYPDRFLPNNVIFETGATIDWLGLARKVYYNVELLWLPGRVFNDFSGLTIVTLPILAWVAWRSRGRPRFYAVAAIAVEGLLRLNTPEFAYVFLRPIHLLSVFTPVALAAFLVHEVRSRWRIAAFVAMVGIYLQIWWHPVPHIAAVEQVEPALVERLRADRGGLVLLENTFHRDMDASPASVSAPTPFTVHFESLLPAATGRRFYAGMWDGWQWSPERERLLSGGAFRGRALALTPAADFLAELRRWGVRDVVVWSEPSRIYLDALPAVARTWSEGRWHGYRVVDADAREIVVASGRGELRDLTPLGGVVALHSVRAGEPVTVRTSWHPEWRAHVDGAPLPLHEADGQIAFTAPRSGSYVVRLRYPARTWLLWTSLLGVAVAATSAAFVARRRRRSGPTSRPVVQRSAGV